MGCPAVHLIVCPARQESGNSYLPASSSGVQRSYLHPFSEPSQLIMATVVIPLSLLFAIRQQHSGL
uniref:Uncharacterized protein n=2 Tax=Rhizophora mucronata TaxID=61149 RepID=A0A2P2MQL8_RHIMU